MKYCQNCGAQMEDNMQFCPNCGAPAAKEEPKTESVPVENVVVQGTAQFQGQTEKTNGFAIAGFVCAVVSPFLIFCCCSHILTSILAIIFSIVGLVQIKKTGEKGKGLAIAGLVIAIFLLVSSIAFTGAFSLIPDLETEFEEFYNEFYQNYPVDDMQGLEDYLGNFYNG